MTEATGKSLPPRPRGRRSPMGGGGKSWLLNSAEKMLIIILSWCRWDRLILYRCCVKIVQRFNINTSSLSTGSTICGPWDKRLVSKQIKVLLGFCKLPSPIAGTVGLINYYGIFWLVSSQDGVWLFWQIEAPVLPIIFLCFWCLGAFQCSRVCNVLKNPICVFCST